MILYINYRIKNKIDLERNPTIYISSNNKMENVNDIIVDANAFQAKNVYYAKPKTNPSGGKNVSVMDSSIKKPLVLSTPLMLTWGINEWIAEDTGKKSYDLSLQFPREDDDNYEKCKNFIKGMKELEEKLLKDALVNSKEWFGKKYDLVAVVEALFTPMLRYPKDQNGDFDYSRAPSMRIKLPYWDGKFTCELYDLQGDMIFPDISNDVLSPVSLITKGQKIATVIKCGGIWFAGGKFGVTWKLVQAVVQPRFSLSGKCHIKLDQKERQDLKQATLQVESEDEDDTCVTTQVEDSDDDETTEQQAVPEEPVPVQAEPVVEPVAVPEEPVQVAETAKPVKKRVVRKKVT